MVCPLEVKNIYASSENRNIAQDPYGNAYTLYISTPIKDITQVDLVYASIPNTMYNLTNGSSVIGITDTNGSTITMKSLPSGFYTPDGLANEIAVSCFASSHIDVFWLPSEGKFMFSRATANGDFTLKIASGEMATLLGFPGIGEYPSFTPLEYADNLRYAGKYALKSQVVANLNTYPGVFLDIQELRSNFNECALQGGSSGASRSFGMIPMDVASGSIKTFKKMSDFDSQIDYMYPIQRLDRLTVRWVDKNGKLLDFNGANDNSFILRFHTLRRNLC